MTIERILNQPVIPTHTETDLLPAKRTIESSFLTKSLGLKSNLIEKLNELKEPSVNKAQSRKKFNEINRFLQSVLDRPDATISIPHTIDVLEVNMDGKYLPLSHLGTGIHEIILIAAFCTLKENQIICLEEPEIHLHPILQKKLIRYLKDQTSNQYFIATHSAAFIDTPDASIYRVENDGVQTHIQKAKLDSEKRKIVDELGYKASDILQANSIIWVEGPSERVYLNHWIKALDRDLIEGIHYTIMFYGGRLLSHLSADTDEVNDFIGLKSINHNMAVIFDSDKTGEDDVINETKERVIDELTEDGNAVAWLTAGREIENYIDYDILQECIEKVHSRLYGKKLENDQFGHAFHFQQKDSDEIYIKADKVKVAQKVCEGDADLDILDLRKRITSIVEMIRRANAI